MSKRERLKKELGMEQSGTTEEQCRAALLRHRARLLQQLKTVEERLESLEWTNSDAKKSTCSAHEWVAQFPEGVRDNNEVAFYYCTICGERRH